MSTKTMRLPPRRQLTASSSAPPPSTNSHKRKERDESDDALDGLNPSNATVKSHKPKAESEPPANTSTDGLEPPSSPVNHLLAGYLAHEFLTKGTVMGQVWDPSRAEEAIGRKEGEEGEPNKEELKDEKRQRYVEVARLLMMDGTHLHRLVNPTEFAQFLYRAI